MEVATLEEARRYIDSIDFSKLKDKMVSHSGWIRADVEKTCHQYRNFLFLKKKYERRSTGLRLPPSQDIDHFWHAHILDTYKYVEDCQKIFGTYLHHYPYFGIDEESTMADAYKAFLTTCDLYQKEFGEDITPTRSRFSEPIYAVVRWLS